MPSGQSSSPCRPMQSKGPDWASDQDTAASADERQRLMTPEEVRSIRSDRIEFGSHALTHASLPGLPRAEKAREIRGSVAACEELAGTHPLTFAYPFGDFDPSARPSLPTPAFVAPARSNRARSAPDDRPLRAAPAEGGQLDVASIAPGACRRSWQAGSVAVEA